MSLPRIRIVAGFTLTELLAVIAIIGVLAAIIIPVVGKMRASADSSHCASNIRQIAVAAQLYGVDNKGIIIPWRPPLGSAYWSTVLMPYVGVKKPAAGNVEDSVFMCPVEKANTKGELYYSENRIWTRYSLNLHITWDGDPAVASQRRTVRYAQIDYPSKTYLVIDLFGASGGGYWMGPNLVYPHNNKVNVAFVDGHVEAETKEQMDHYCGSLHRAFWQGYNWDGYPTFTTD